MSKYAQGTPEVKENRNVDFLTSLNIVNLNKKSSKKSKKKK